MNSVNRDIDAPVNDALPATFALPLLQALPALGNTTTVILHGGCVFEFKGPFPTGTVAGDFYNLEGSFPGFHGHLRLRAMNRVCFQDKPHRGRPSYAFVFADGKGHCLFKVFLGRDDSGEIFASQLNFFHQLRKARKLQQAPEVQA